MKDRSKAELHYDFFISYRTRKRTSLFAAKFLQNLIEDFDVPSASNLKVFRDDTALESGLLSPQLEVAVRGSKKLVLICSERDESAQSEFMQKELSIFLSENNNHINDVIPIILDGQFENAAPEPLASIPEASDLLIHRTNSRQRRIIKKKLRSILPRMVASVSGVSLEFIEDRVAERERIIRSSRLRFSAIAISLVITMMISLGIEVGRRQFIVSFSESTAPLSQVIFGIFSTSSIRAKRGEPGPKLRGHGRSRLTELFHDDERSDSELLSYACYWLTKAEIENQELGSLMISDPRWRKQRKLELLSNQIFKDSLRRGSAVRLIRERIVGQPSQVGYPCCLRSVFDSAMGRIYVEYGMSSDGFNYTLKEVEVPIHLDLDTFRIITASSPATIEVPIGTEVELLPSVTKIFTIPSGFGIESLERANTYLGRSPNADLPHSDISPAAAPPRETWRPSFFEYATMAYRMYQMNRAGLIWTYRVESQTIGLNELDGLGGQNVINAAHEKQEEKESIRGFVWRISSYNRGQSLPVIRQRDGLGITISMEGRNSLFVALQLHDDKFVSNRVTWQINTVSDEVLKQDIEFAEQNTKVWQPGSPVIMVPGLLRNVFSPDIELIIDDRQFNLGKVDNLVLDLRRFEFIPAGERNVQVYEIPHKYDVQHYRQLVFSGIVKLPENSQQ